jgi:hypothetical protein
VLRLDQPGLYNYLLLLIRSAQETLLSLLLLQEDHPHIQDPLWLVLLLPASYYPLL